MKKTIITKDTLHINQLIGFFESDPIFTIEQITSFYKRFEAEVKRNTIDWRIHQLKKLNVIYRISRGCYSLKEQNEFNPQIDDALHCLYKEITEHFPFIEVCIWNTKWLNQFMCHQIGKFFILIEVDRDSVESVFYYLREKHDNLFLNPPAEILEKYGDNKKETIIIKPLISESPILKVDKVQIAPLEKILVDLMSDELFEAYQGQELENIYQSVLEKHTINQPQMLRYASRRNKKKEVISKLKILKELN